VSEIFDSLRSIKPFNIDKLSITDISLIFALQETTLLSFPSEPLTIITTDRELIFVFRFPDPQECEPFDKTMAADKISCSDMKATGKLLAVGRVRDTYYRSFGDPKGEIGLQALKRLMLHFLDETTGKSIFHSRD
jgi:hypothetical protein